MLAYVPESALMVSGDAPLDLAGLGVTWLGRLAASDKLSPALETEPAGAYLVIFHPDADMEQARAMVRRRGFEVLENRNLSRDRLLVTGVRERLAELAARDPVAYIMPATVELATRRQVLWCPGPIAEAGPIAEYALAGSGWSKDASGKVALQYYFNSLTTKISANTARSQIERAFQTWAELRERHLRAGGFERAGRAASTFYSPAERTAMRTPSTARRRAGPHVLSRAAKPRTAGGRYALRRLRELGGGHWRGPVLGGAARGRPRAGPGSFQPCPAR